MFCAKKAIFPLSLAHLFSGFLGFGQECFPADMFLGVGIIVAVVASSGGCHRWFLDFVFYVVSVEQYLVFFFSRAHSCFIPHLAEMVGWTDGRTQTRRHQ